MFPGLAKAALRGRVQTRLELRKRRVDLLLVCCEERAEMCGVEVRGTGCLREREVEEEECLGGVVEWEPVVKVWMGSGKQ